VRKFILAIASALVIVTPLASMAMKHTINQSGLTFAPNTLTIVQGDTVEWVWAAGSHTVTNGNGASDPNAGTLFDESLNSANQIVEYVFSAAGTYPYFCRPHETFGMTGTITVDLPTGVRAPLAAATLRQNYPNPFAAATGIEYALPEPAVVTLRVYDVRGRLVATLQDGNVADGLHRAGWNGRDSTGKPAPAGIYFYRLESGAAVLTRKLVIVR
jgi:plastocyanin